MNHHHHHHHDCCNKDHFGKFVKEHWTLLPALLMVGCGVMEKRCDLVVGGLVAAAIIYELQEIKKCCKNSCWY